MKVTVMGLGLMGTALAEALLRNGHETTVWNRSPAKAAPLVGKGAAQARTPAEAVAASDLVIVCLSVYANVQDVLDEAAGALAGRTVANLTNGTPRQARAMAERVAGHGADYLDGGIMAVPPMIGNPGALVLYSGSRRAFDAHRGTLEALAGARFLGGDAGLAPLYDLALLSAMYGMFGGYYHAMALVGTEKVTAEEFTPMVADWLTAMLAGLPGAARHIDGGDHATEVSSIANNAAGFPNLVDAARDQGIGTTLLEPIGELIDRAYAEGHGADALTRLVELIQNPRPE
ncbi:NAD(P)-dependent oxidoreductase [Actinomadura rugatobispora]|uniref:NAD(P)-dependent oxidoreductase n=1 Tax=Actinomadura rugatobispora TaxID=1994 RepID=A0ABW0ZVS4_9ACTN|nr:NAD(P)-binding domain-containing protein [Actinomadura rugatobispora]